MENVTTPPTADLAQPKVKRKSNPWGLLIGLLLILAIVVLGAYHAFTNRIAPATNGQYR